MATTSAWAEDDSREWPFTLSTSYESAVWYQMSVRNGYYCYYDEDNNNRISTGGTPSYSDDKYSFAFVGTKEGFTIYNKAAGKDKPFGPKTANGDVIAGSDTDKGTFIFEYSTEAGYTSNQLLRYADENGLNYLNHSGYSHLSVWNTTSNRHDPGSNFVFYEIPDYSGEIDGIFYNLYNSNNTAYLTQDNQKCTLTDVVVPEYVEYGSNKYKVVGLLGQTFRGNTTIKNVSFESSSLNYSGSGQPFEMTNTSNSLTSLTLPPPTSGTSTSLPTWFAHNSNLEELVIPEGFTAFTECAVRNCQKLKKLTLPSTIESIGWGNFAEATFSNADNSYYIIINRSTPPTVDNVSSGATYFKNFVNATVVVPDETAKTAYEADDIWKTAKSIITKDQYNNPKTITWNVVDDNNNIITTATSTVYYGSTANVPTSLTSIPGVALNGTTSVTGDGEDHTINLTYTFDDSQWPFELSTSYDDATWYQMTIHSGMNIQYNANGGTLSSRYAVSDDDKYSFAFVGTPFGFKLYNKAAGNKPFGPATCSGNGTEFKASSESDAAELLYTLNNGNKTICYKNSTSQFFNNYGGDGEQSIKTWQSSENMEFYLATSTVTNGLYYSVSGTNATVASGNDGSHNLNNRRYNQILTSEELTVPSSVTIHGTKYTITAIGDRAFQDNTSLKSVTFEGNVSLNGTAVFQGCDNLETVTFNGTTNSALGGWFFAICPKLKNVNLPAGVTSIGSFAFGGDKNLTNLTLPSTVTSINSDAFNDWTNTGYRYPTYVAPNVVLTADASSTLTYKNLVKGSVCETLSLHDGASFAPSAGFTATTATYTRTMSGTWGTIVLPFSAKSDNVKFYTVQKVDESGNLVVEEEETLAAGTPAIIKKVTETTSITCTATDATETISSTINSTTATNGDFQLIGSYTQDKLVSDNNAYYIYDDKFYRNGSSFYADAFRAYLQGSSSSGTDSPAFNILVDDDPTGISNATGTDDAAEIEGIYSVSGVKQSDLQKGINIVRYRNGKTQKVILK